jgi:ribosomal protein S18 acetylase RimI-like enzyme
MTSTFKVAGSSGSITIRLAKLPTDLTDIRDCRKSAYANKAINLPAAKSFVNADQIMKEGYICVIATNDANEQRKSGVVVLGTDDLNTKTGVVNNVYVRNEARKCGVGRAMMQTVEEYYVKNNTNNNANSNKKKKLKLTVTLYKSLGFTAPGIYQSATQSTR